MSTKITWVPPREESRDRPFKVAFAAVQSVVHMDMLIRFCHRNPNCVNGFEVEAQLSKAGRELVPPRLCLKFFPAGARSRSTIDFKDIISIACDARLPDPVSINCDYSGRDTCAGFIVYHVPAHAEEFLLHCQRNPKYTKQGDCWDLECSFEVSRRE